MEEYENGLFCFAIQEFPEDRLVLDTFHSHRGVRQQEENGLQENNKYSKRAVQGRKLVFAYCLVYNTGLSWRPRLPIPTFLLQT